MTIFDLVSNRIYGNKHVLTKLIEHHVGIPYKEIILHYDDVVSQYQVDAIVSDYWKYEKDKMPLEYIVGHVDFLGNSFAIDQRAMIPRPETEYMIEGVIEGVRSSKLGVRSYEILDLGCGCGVLGLSVGLLAEHKPTAISFRDLSPDAISLANQNIEHYKVALEGVKLTARVSRGLEELQNHPQLLERWQQNPLIIVCNYPYIPDETFEDNADECAKTREPRMAFLGGPDGLDLYRVLLNEIKNYKLTHAVLYLEMMTFQFKILNDELGVRTYELGVESRRDDISGYAGYWDFQIIKTFHFNIIIVKAQWRD